MPENNFSLKIKGLEQLKRNLDEFPIKLSKLALREAIVAGARVLVEEAKNNAPVDTGQLKQSVGMKITMGHNLDRSIASVGPRYKKDTSRKRNDHSHAPGIYGRFVEIGTSKMPPKPWLRPALSAAKEKAVTAFANSLKANVAKIAQALGSKRNV